MNLRNSRLGQIGEASCFKMGVHLQKMSSLLEEAGGLVSRRKHDLAGVVVSLIAGEAKKVRGLLSGVSKPSTAVQDMRELMLFIEEGALNNRSRIQRREISLFRQSEKDMTNQIQNAKNRAQKNLCERK